MPVRKLMPSGPMVMWSAVGNWKPTFSFVSVSPQEKTIADVAKEHSTIHIAAPLDHRRTPNLPSNIKLRTGQRDDWSCGRSLEKEETAVGMLTTLGESRDAEAMKLSKQRKAAGLVEHYKPQGLRHRLNCVIKCNPCDWQVNEITRLPVLSPLHGHRSAEGTAQRMDDSLTPSALSPLSAEETYVTERARKGRWAKVRKDATVDVETNPTDNEPGYKDYQKRLATFGEYKQIKGKAPNDAPLLRFQLYRENTTISTVVSRAKHTAGLHPDAFSFVSEKEGFGCVSQCGSVVGAGKDAIPHVSRKYNIHPIIMSPLEYENPATGGIVDACAGNRWRALLRCVSGSETEIREAIKRVQEQGFVNYVPLNAFSICANQVHLVNALASQGNYIEACRLWMQSEAERNALFQEKYLEYIAADENSAPGVLRVLAKILGDYRSFKPIIAFLTTLADLTERNELTDASAKQLWRLVPKQDTAVYRDATSAYVWNAMASQRLLVHGPKVVAGDLVWHRKKDRLGTMVVKRVADGEEGLYSLHDVLIPMPTALYHDPRLDVTVPKAVFPTAEGITREDYTRFIEHSGAAEAVKDSALADRSEFMLQQRRLPLYRRLVERPRPTEDGTPLMECHVIEDPNSLTILKSDLFLRQEHKIPPRGLSNLTEAKGDEYDAEARSAMPNLAAVTGRKKHERIRYPCEYNVSEAFRERMQPIIHDAFENRDRRRPSCSVALSFVLPAGAHPTTMLREVFNVKHGNFHDLLSPQLVDWDYLE